MRETKNKKLFGILFFVFNAFLTVVVLPARANNLVISNVSLQDRDSSADTAIVQFDLSWDNSWRTPTNHDAVWVVLKVTINSGTPVHGNMKNAGTDPAGTSPGTSASNDLEIYVPSDKVGAFIRRKSTGSGTVSTHNVRLKLDYAAAGAADTDTISVKVIGIEMVYIPTSPFYAGDTSSTGSLKQGSGDTDPWYISSEGAINVNQLVSDGYYYVSGSNAGESSTGAEFTIPAAFPKGYAAFYCMKYPITEGQWVDFINNIGSSAQTNRDITSNTNGGKNSDSVVKRNSISQAAGVASTSRSDRPVSYISWMDLSAYLDWVGLRPMTELEYEKICRGPLSAVSGEYAWGSTNLTAAVTISGSAELGLETVLTNSANANYNSTTFSRGDDFLGSEYVFGPLRAGIFATASSTREAAGASYYGVMQMSGDLWERVVTIGNSTGIAYTGGHGDGTVDVVASYEGNANTSGWVSGDGTASHGVTGATGAGEKGGAWDSANTALRISDRSKAANTDTARANNYGGRGVRTYDGS